MRKSILMLATMAMMLTLAACGNDNDEPRQAIDSAWNSVYQSATDTHFSFYPTLQPGVESAATGMGTIMLYNVQFTIGERTSPKMNIRIDAPVGTNKNEINYHGNNIIPYLMMGTTPTPAEQFAVTNLVANVNVKDKTYSISFDCHGVSFSSQGKVVSIE